MAESTVIGRSTFVRGRVNGTGDLAIAGRVEGDVSCTGQVTVESGGLVAANIAATRIVVRGAVKGDLVAEEALLIESGARVVGDLRAPRIAIAQGGLVRGHVQTAGSAGGRPARTAHHAQSVETKSRAAAAPPARVAPPPAPSKAKTNHKPAVRGATLSGARPPPAPVVPVLKKGTKAVQKKRA